MSLPRILERAINSGMRKNDMLTSQQVAEELSVPYSTVMLWLKQGRFPGAQLDESNPRGPVWFIPRSALDTFERPSRGRPKTNQPDGKAAPTRKRSKSK